MNLLNSFMAGKTAIFTRTRIAPTPSGFLHLGNMLSFAITVALAQKKGAKILLRIDDLDRTRVNRQYLHDIFDTLNFLEIPWDEGPLNVEDFENNYSQIHRLNLYNEALGQLADEGKVFACTCSRSQLSGDRNCSCREQKIQLNTENAAWRLITGNFREIAVKNFDGKVIGASLPGEMNNFIVRKKDGLPAYQLTSVIDDLFYGVDMVVRGADLWPSTVAQHELAFALGNNRFGGIVFYHHPLLTDSSGDKLSKSAGATSVKYLRESGKSPADVYQLIAAMLGSNKTVVNWQQLVGITSFVSYF